MAELPSNLKRKSRNSSSSETVSPDGKRICEVSKKEINSSADGNGKKFTSASTMTEIITQQLQQVLERLTSVEGKLDGVLEKVQRLETALSGVKSDITELQSKTTQMKKVSDDMEAGLNNLNTEVEELRKKIGEREKEIKLMNDRCLYQEVYNRRENLRFLGFPEATSNEEVASETVYQFLERELELEGVRDSEFQRVHRIGKKKAGAVRPIIARFLRFPDRERIFRRALEVRDVTEVRVFTDLPKEIQERRKKQWPKLKKAREEGKVASFDRKEPDKLYIDGHFIPI